jgi:FtsH-binding integral membrane protein
MRWLWLVGVVVLLICWFGFKAGYTRDWIGAAYFGLLTGSFGVSFCLGSLALAVKILWGARG